MRCVQPATRPTEGVPQWLGQRTRLSARCLGFSLWLPTTTVSWPFTLSDGRFPRSTQEPELSSRHLHAGHSLGSKQVAPRLLPRERLALGFDAVGEIFDTSSVVHSRSPS